MNCLDKGLAVAYLGGDLEPAEADRVSDHLANCFVCRSLVEEVSGLVDGVRRDLLAAEGNPVEDEFPPSDQIRQQCLNFTGGSEFRPVPSPFQSVSTQPSILKQFARPFLGGRAHFNHQVLVLTLAVVAVIAFWLFQGRQVVTADEILKRAEQANVNVLTLPDRIIHRVWKESILNGNGPLPDGEYRCECWSDNLHNRFARLFSDDQGRLREGSWWLADGTSYVFMAYDLERPEVILGPADKEVLGEINRLPAEKRGKVLTLFMENRKPLLVNAAQEASRAQRDIADSLVGRKTDITVHEVALSGGKKAFRIFYHVDVTAGNAAIKQWDKMELILDKTFSRIGLHSTGYRTDGLVYQRNSALLEEQVFIPGDRDPSAFTPGPFPPSVRRRSVTPEERVEVYQRQLRLLPAIQD